MKAPCLWKILTKMKDDWSSTGFIEFKVRSPMKIVPATLRHPARAVMNLKMRRGCQGEHRKPGRQNKTNNRQSIRINTANKTRNKTRTDTVKKSCYVFLCLPSPKILLWISICDEFGILNLPLTAFQVPGLGFMRVWFPQNIVPEALNLSPPGQLLCIARFESFW